MHRKSEIGRWRNFIHQMVSLAKERKNIFILGSIAFMGVFREVFETVVFLRALLLEAGEITNSHWRRESSVRLAWFLFLAG